MSFIGEQLLGGVRLLTTSAVFYFTAPVLLGVAAIPAALRTYQLLSGNDNGWLELVVEALRVGLVAAMIVVGRAGTGSSGRPWTWLGKDIVHAYRTGWVGILIQLAVVTAIILGFNAVFESLVTAESARGMLTALQWDTSRAEATALAITFAVKNFVVIPLYLVAMLVASGVIRR